jgi:hypothetical protein
MLKTILNSNWFITLSSTILGIVIGIYLTNFSNHRSLLHKKDLAVEQVMLEIKENHEDLKDYYGQLSQAYPSFDYMLDKLNADGEIIIAKDSLEVFQGAMADIFVYENNRAVGSDSLKISGELSVAFDSKLSFSKLSSVVWDAYKQTDYLSVTDFECITSIQFIYDLQEEVNALNRRWINTLFLGNFMDKPEATRSFMVDWKTLLQKQQLLLDVYEPSAQAMEDCQ